MTRTLAPLALLVSLSGCIIFDGTGGGKACDTSAASSVAVSVSATDGGDVSSAVVTYSVDGSAFRPCDSFPGDGEFACGWEEAGPLAVRVEAIGYVTHEETVFVEQGECHVIPQHLDVALEPNGSEERVESVVVTVSGSGGEALEDVDVQWSYRDAEMAPQPCDPMDDGTWVCGWAVQGDLEIYAEAGGHAGQMVSVHVDADERHVITEYVTIALEWLPD